MHSQASIVSHTNRRLSVYYISTTKRCNVAYMCTDFQRFFNAPLCVHILLKQIGVIMYPVIHSASIPADFGQLSSIVSSSRLSVLNIQATPGQMVCPVHDVSHHLHAALAVGKWYSRTASRGNELSTPVLVKNPVESR